MSLTVENLKALVSELEEKTGVENEGISQIIAKMKEELSKLTHTGPELAPLWKGYIKKMHPVLLQKALKAAWGISDGWVGFDEEEDDYDILYEMGVLDNGPVETDGPVEYDGAYIEKSFCEWLKRNSKATEEGLVFEES